MASYTYDHIELGDEHSLGCKCCRFGRGDDLPVPKKLSHDEMLKLVDEFSHSVFADWTKLNAILKRFESSIQKRWLRKSPSQRREILLKAWPDMARTHRPDFAIGFRNSKKQQPRSRSLISAAYLWPYINLEDLTQRHLLLLYLNSRGRNLPYKFVSADIEAAHLGHGWHGSVEDDCHVMRFLYHDSPRTYGQLINYNNDYEKTTAASGHALVSIPVKRASEVQGTGMAYLPCLGLLGLEIQQGIYSFLLSCAKLILHEMPPSAFFTAPHQPTPALIQASASDWPSFTAHMLEAPYRVPQNMDLERMRTLISARRCSAEDHLWMLREDPGYFIETLREWKEHDRSMLNHPCPNCWAAVVAYMLADAYCHLMFWDQIHVLFDSMPPLDEQLKRANHRTLRLQPKDERRWAQILEIIDYMIEFPIATLREGVPPAPRLRRCYTWFKGGRPDDPLWSAKYSIMTQAEFRVNVLFRSICSHEQRSLHGLNHLVQEVQYMLDTDGEASESVDSWMVGHYSDLALLSELKLRVEGLMPWCQSWKAMKVHESKEVRDAVDGLFKADMLVGSFMSKACIECNPLVDALSHDWDYPVSKARTEANVEKLRRAEAKLDLLWTSLEVKIRMHTKASIFELMAGYMPASRTLLRTPEWLPELIEQPKSTVRALQERDLNVNNFHGSFQDDDISSPKTASNSKAKIKTRGAPKISTTKEAAILDSLRKAKQDPPPSTQTPHLKVKVPKRAYKVLSALFPESTSANHQRIEIAWTELLQAMDTIGLQPEKLYGSVWMFRPKTSVDTLVDMKRSIQFHEPKEVRRGNKIPQSMVRVFGRRLKHAFGWEDGMFVCE